MRALTAVILMGFVLAACSGSPEIDAQIGCESFIEQRTGAEDIEFDTEAAVHPLDGEFDVATGETREDVENGWYVRSRFDIPSNDDGVVVYECEIINTDDGWRLLDLSTDR